MLKGAGLLIKLRYENLGKVQPIGRVVNHEYAPNDSSLKQKPLTKRTPRLN
jgi:hypothetical protein